jgi:hypothetical protein
MEAIRKTKIPLKPKLGYTPTKSTLGICLHSTIGRMPSDRISRSLNVSLEISTRVLRFEASGALRSQTGQAGFGQTSTPGLQPRLCGSAEQPSDFLLNHRKPRELDVSFANHHS